MYWFPVSPLDSFFCVLFLWLDNVKCLSLSLPLNLSSASSSLLLSHPSEFFRSVIALVSSRICFKKKMSLDSNFFNAVFSWAYRASLWWVFLTLFQVINISISLGSVSGDLFCSSIWATFLFLHVSYNFMLRFTFLKNQPRIPVFIDWLHTEEDPQQSAQL